MRRVDRMVLGMERKETGPPPGRQRNRANPTGLISSSPEVSGHKHQVESMKQYNIAVIPGDGTGPEVVREAIKVLDAAAQRFNLKLNYTHY
ncbi:MAG: isocitrate/isopropylmalate family dehydrogenase, partial [Verrucomicrobiia bacterium]